MIIGIIIVDEDRERFIDHQSLNSLKVNGKSLIERIVDIYLENKISEIYIIGNKENINYYNEIDDRIKTVIRNEKEFLTLVNERMKNRWVVAMKSNSFIVDKKVINDFCNTKGKRNKRVYKKVVYFFKGRYLKNINKIFDNRSKKNREIIKVNNVVEFEKALKEYYLFNCYKYKNNGVEIVDALNTYIEEDVVVEKNVKIYPNNYIVGKTHIEEGSTILPFCFIENAFVGKGSSIGPYTYIRKGSIIGEKNSVGAFVEVKESEFGKLVKAKHHAYLGNVKIGDEVNIGCGTIIANYNGVSKKNSTIGNKCFIGANVTIVSPVNIEKNALLAAGSTIVRDVEEDTLAIARSKQINKVKYMKINEEKRKIQKNP